MTTEPENHPNDHSLHKRIDELEHVVSQLQEQLNTVLDRLEDSTQPQVVQSRSTPAQVQRKTAVSSSAVPKRKKPTSSEPKPYLQGDFWLNKIGIALMLFALAFLFKFAIDQGWLTPVVRVAIGLILGTTLLLVGLRLHKKRRAFAVVLLGGSMASFYITGFAAFQLYELVSFPIAFGFMVLVSLLTFSLAVRQNEAVLALIGTVGGFATPFLLYTDGDGNVPGLVAYSCILILLTVGIYVYKGWRVLLWTATGLGWIVLWVAEDSAVRTTAVPLDKWSVQIGLSVAWLAFWGVPLLRHFITQNRATALPKLSVGFADRHLPQFIKQIANLDLHVYAVTAVFLLLMSTFPLWDFEQTTTGWFFVGFALLYGLIAMALYQISIKNLAITHAITATLLLTFSFLILLDNEALLIALTLEIIAWHLLNTRLQNRWAEGLTHLFSAIVAIWMFARLTTGETTSDNTAVRVLADSFVIISYTGIAVLCLPQLAKRLYLLAVHIAILLIFWREFSELNNGQGLVSIAWGSYAIILLIVGLRFRINECRLAGLATLFLLVAKLFLVDLSEVKPIWRILLFFGFGGAFMLLSYFYQTLWRANPNPPIEEPVTKT